MAKIEKPQALERLDEILELVDAVMVARGDLGVELPPEGVPPVQNRIVATARQFGKPAVVGVTALEIDLEGRRMRTADGKVLNEGDWISIDGTTGEVFEGQVKTVVPPGQSASKNAAHSGTAATNTLAAPDSTCCSAQTTTALPPSRRKTPVIAFTRQSRQRRGSRSPVATTMPASRSPAIRKRTPAKSIGGRCITPTRMAR